MTHEQIGIILEIIAFFLVTVDLYGEERLSRLSYRMVKLSKIVSFATIRAQQNFANFLNDVKPTWFSPRVFANEVPSTWLWPRASIVFLMMLVITVLDYLYVSRYTSIVITNVFFNLVLNVIIVAIATSLSVILALVLAYIAIVVLTALIVGISVTVARLKLSGWMLIVGSALFLFAKGLALFASMQEKVHQ
jgi:hypothetical protein